VQHPPTPEQAAIFDAVRDPHGGSIFVDAGPGAGKTTTAVGVAQYIPRGLFLAFNKAIAATLGQRLQGTGLEARTVHSLGFAAIRAVGAHPEIDGRKYDKILRRTWDSLRATGHPLVVRDDELADAQTEALGGASPTKKRPQGPLYQLLGALVDAARLDLVDPADEAAVLDLAARREIGLPLEAGDPLVGPFCQLLRVLLLTGKEQAGTALDYTDMVWLPWAVGLACPQYPWVVADEAQDLSRAHQDLLRRALAPGGRVLAVGDRYQSIYAFAGADPAAVDRLITDFDLRTLPLHTTFRCARSVVGVANALVSERPIAARAGAGEGVVRTMHAENLNEVLAAGDLVLCRVNYLLVELAMERLVQGLPVVFKGRDLAGGVLATLREAGWSPSNPHAVTAWLEAQTAGMDEDDPAQEGLYDRARCATAVARGCNSLGEVERKLARLSGSEEGAPYLASIHAAKGLEADRVFVLGPELVPSPRAATKVAWVQERNLQYVAATRAKEELVFALRNLEVPGEEQRRRERPWSVVTLTPTVKSAPPTLQVAVIGAPEIGVPEPDAEPDGAGGPVDEVEQLLDHPEGPAIEAAWRAGDVPNAVRLTRAALPSLRGQPEVDVRWLLRDLFGPVWSGFQRVDAGDEGVREDV